MNKLSVLFCTLIISVVFTLPACAAQKIKVNALTPFNSLDPTDKMKVITLERVEFDNGIVFEDGTVVYGDIIDVKQPKRAKRNASFKFKPTSYLYNGQTYTVNDPEFIAKYVEYKELNKAEIATSAAATAGGIIFHIPLLSEGVSFVKGVIKNPEDNRFKSGAVQVYKDSPLSYIEEGKDIDIHENTMFILKFKSSDLEDLDAEQPDEEQVESQNQSETATPVNIPEQPADKQINIDNSQQSNDTVVPVVPASDVGNAAEHIIAVDPEKVLREVELNTK